MTEPKTTKEQRAELRLLLDNSNPNHTDTSAEIALDALLFIDLLDDLEAAETWIKEREVYHGTSSLGSYFQDVKA